MCATTVSRKWTRIRGVCVHSVGQLRLTKEWTENTTDSGPSKGSVVAQHTQRIRIHRSCSQHLPQESLVCATTVSRKGTRIRGVCVHSVGRLRLTKEWTENTTDCGPSKGSVVAQHTQWNRISLVFLDTCHKNPWYVRRQYPEHGQEYMVLVSTPLGGCGSRKSGQKTPRILVHQRVVSWHSTQWILLLYPCRNSSRVAFSIAIVQWYRTTPLFLGVDGRTILPLGRVCE